jgi:uncharacterized protein YjbJ (UPF0337 family)
MVVKRVVEQYPVPYSINSAVIPLRYVDLTGLRFLILRSQKMISSRYIRSLVRTFIVTISLAVVITFFFGFPDSFAATSALDRGNQAQPQIAATNRVEAVTKNIEGKAQEALGDITNDPKNQMMGKAKQAESQVRNAVEDSKDAVTQLKGRAKATTKNLEGRAQEAVGNVTGDPKNQVAGKAKQVEGQTGNLVEDVKDRIQNLFD